MIGLDFSPIRTLDSVTFAFSWGWAGLILFLLVLMPIFYYSYRFEGKKVKENDRRFFLILRGLFLFIVLCLLAGLNVIATGGVPKKNKIAVMIDSSRSMGIKEKGTTRLEKYKGLFQKQNFIEKLRKKTTLEPDIFTFSDNVSPLSKQELETYHLKPTGAQTNLSGAIKDVAGNLGESSLLGVIVLSDGAQTTKENPLNALMNTRVPVSFISPGESGSTKDLSITLKRPPATGYLNSSIRIHGEIGLYKIATNSINVQIQKDGKFLRNLSVKANSGERKVNFAFNLPFDKEGNFRYSVSVPELKDEITTDNNQTSFLVRVVKERLNVLILAEKPSWDLRFISSALKTDPNAQLTSWVKLFDNRWSKLVDFKLKNSQRIFDPKADIKKADVIIIKDLSALSIKPFAKDLLERIESGLAGLLILPGTKGYADIGHIDGKLESIFPVQLNSEKWRGTPGNMLLPTQEPAYNFLRLVDDPIENLDFFRTLPKFEGLYTYNKLKAGVEILVSSTVTHNGSPAPFMLKHRVGQGNAVMITGGPIWPMGFRMVSSERGIQTYTAFMINLLKWLANRREDAQVTIELPSSRGYTGQTSTIRVWVMNGKRQLQQNAQVRVELEDTSGQKVSLTCLETSEKGCYESSFVPATKGVYKISTTASYQGRQLGKANSELLIEPPTAEFDMPEIQHDLMKRIASETGGSFVNIDKADELVQNIKYVAGEKKETKIVELRDSWLILLILLILPLIEWYFRRTKGLS
jgi:cbb3-type cytochrome oxidase subunit 3